MLRLISHIIGLFFLYGMFISFSFESLSHFLLNPDTHDWAELCKSSPKN